MRKRKVNIILRGHGQKPSYKTLTSAGADIYAANHHDIIIQPLERKLIPTGIFMELPTDAEAEIRPRSGLSLKEGIVAILGTIDSDYQGEIGVILVNLSDEPVIIKRHDRVAQFVLIGREGLFQAEWTITDKFERESERGEGGFGSTGK